ncbi:MAG TPA: glycosyltransferase family 4 protein [Anaerolineales bacterium]
MLVNEFPPLPVGGAERQAERLSANLAGRGWMVWVLTRRAPGLPARESRSGFEIIRPASFGAGKLRTVSFVLGSLAELWRLRKSYEILHAHLAFGPAFAAVVGAHFLGKRVVVKLGNSGEFGDIRVSQSTWRGRLRLASLRRWADMIIVLDKNMQEETLSAGFDPTRVRRLLNGIDSQAYIPTQPKAIARKALGLEGKTVVLSMGRLSAQKSLPVLFKAFAAASAENPALHLFVLGDGPDRPSLEALARSLNIFERVTFAGNQDDVRPYLAASDVFALPSASEGISNALLEAAAAGLVCLATPVGGSPEVLDHGRCGLLLPVADVDAWAAALLKVGRSPSLRADLGKAAAERVRSEYDFEVTGARVESLYTELLGWSKPGQGPRVDGPLVEGKR